MTLFVYITEKCKKDMEIYGLRPEVERFRERVEETQSISQFDPFPPPFLVKKKLGGRQGRLICERRSVDDHVVVVFLAILIRGQRNYEDQFAKDPEGYGRQHFSGLLSDEEIRTFVVERTRKGPPTPKPDPSEIEYGLLFGAFGHHQESGAEDLVCETQEWVEFVSEERIANQLALLCAACLDGLSKAPGLHFLPVAGKHEWGVWCLRSENQLLLIAPSTDSNTSEAKKLAQKTADALEGKDATTVLRASRRAYPALLLADDDLWIELEKDPLANLALSPEETEVLLSARGSDHPFPLFINGRAGSGKSTILQYLFADLLFYYLTNRDARVMAPPMYLTANGELLRVARTFVERLLKSETVFVQQANQLRIQDNVDLLNEAFREFQPHLLSLVPAEIRVERFAAAARVDYARFRRMWKDRFGHETHAVRDFGPDISWHVIRSYIKGMSSETFLEPDEYAQLPENQITVTQQAFTDVYNRVWCGWYQTILDDEHLWDDQDLTRYILDEDLAKPTYPAVFCDEAQDFTRLELELLLRLNLFSGRALPPNSISRVPFAFAGDHFQTLNPTGFRWDTIKASFVEKFILALDPTKWSGRADLNYRELNFNYRSTDKIVRFNNHVQALRAALFHLPDLKPQTPWMSKTHSFPVVWFRANDGMFWNKFREHGGFVVIVPCNEGEERTFVQDDPILRENIRVEDDVPLNVLSASRAKGREYPAVIVYGFGANEQTEIVARLESSLAPNDSDRDKSLPLQYFINRLYVAVSRPKRRLVVVDSDDGFRRLWKCAQDEASESTMLKCIKKGPQVWGPEIEGMTIGNPDDLTRDSAVDPLENARAFEGDGLARQDAFLLRQAAQAYRSGGDTAKAKECRARALEADKLFLEAGEAYFDAGFALPDGIRCLWHAGSEGWNSLCNKSSQYSEIQNELEFQWAQTIRRYGAPEDVVDILRRFTSRLGEPAFSESCAADPIWRDGLNALLKPLINSRETSISEEIFNQLASSLDRIRSKGIAVPDLVCAQIFFSVKRYGEAVLLWEKSGDTKGTDYAKAKAAVTPYPQRILLLARLGLAGDIIKEYKEAPEVALTQEQAAAIVDAFRKSDQFDAAFDVAWKSSGTLPMLHLVGDALSKEQVPNAIRALHAGVILLAQQKQWEPLAALASTQRFTPAAEWSEPRFERLVAENIEEIKVNLVRALAHAVGLSDAPAHLQRQLSGFLKKFLRVKDAQWRSRLGVDEAGAAIERAGRFSDAISFYEAIDREGFSSQEKQFARRRWLVCKNRQLQYEKSSGSKRRVKEIEREVGQGMIELRLKSLDELEEFPPLHAIQKPQAIREIPTSPSLVHRDDIGTIDSQTTDTGSNERDQVVMTIGVFKIEISRKNSRCNITHTETLETAFVKIAERKCVGEHEFVQIDTSSWSCPPWKLTVEFPKESDQLLLINVEELGVGLLIRR